MGGDGRLIVFLLCAAVLAGILVGGWSSEIGHYNACRDKCKPYQVAESKPCECMK